MHENRYFRFDISKEFLPLISHNIKIIIKNILLQINGKIYFTYHLILIF